ncbi:hypothetical protein CS542_07240 [Pedobacter sp. IW39]|nr:hypothetical protein CS542_07240 [Pedobacter sp. IW39]
MRAEMIKVEKSSAMIKSFNAVPSIYSKFWNYCFLNLVTSALKSATIFPLGWLKVFLVVELEVREIHFHCNTSPKHI